MGCYRFRHLASKAPARAPTSRLPPAASEVTRLLSDDELARLIDARQTACPNTYASGCRCWEHDPGLLAHAGDPEAFLAFLPVSKAPLPRTPGPSCSADPMVCDCPHHAQERAAAIDRQRARRIVQPWEV